MMIQVLVGIVCLSVASGAAVNCSQIRDPTLCTQGNCTYSQVAQACYNATSQIPCGDAIGHGTICNKGQDCCGGFWSEDYAKCVSPGETCCSGLRHTVVCSAADSCCTSSDSFDGTCFNNKTQICCTPPDSNPGYPWSCPIDKKCTQTGCQ
eukprot:TRINITY_DN16561_c0_g1_i1.p1 TRINITY_DN16561_c0_g1~~TRINITY_DN16561_c0_g1_i1.p1  ORF type:complete len:164 (+),score=30.96 TRINITY_DN16561_c0_g1_i1:41-493(+)